MKKLLFIAIMSAFGIAIGQEKENKLNIEKNTWTFGGEVSLQNTNSDNNDGDSKRKNDTFSIGFYPKFGYAIKNNLIIGLGLGYGYSKNKLLINDSDNIQAITKTYSVFPYVRKYIPIGNKFTFFLQGEFRYSKLKNDNRQNNPIIQNFSAVDTFFAGFRPGITYFLTKNLALEANVGSLGYSTSKYNDSRNRKYNSFNLNLNASNLNFGLSLYL